MDETKASPYTTLPDALALQNGKKVADEKTRWNKRRPEIVEAFDTAVKGRTPKKTPKVNWEVVTTTEEMDGNIPVITKKLVGHVDNTSWAQAIKIDIQMTLTIRLPGQQGRCR